MLVEVGNIWNAWKTADLFLFTGNGVITPEGKLVMGSGFAKEVRDRFPGVDKTIADYIKQETPPHRKTGIYNYSLVISPRWPDAKLGVFQTKQHWGDESDLGTIEHSAWMLRYFCNENPTAKVHMNFPGIGKGGLTEEEVRPCLRMLPDTVHVWRKPNETVSNL